jgi:hypothetical protein
MDWRGRGSNGLCTFSSHRTLFDPRQPDAAFQDQVNELRGLGFGILRVSVDDLGQKGCKIRGVVPEGSTVVYRGWVLAPSEYEGLLKLIATHGAHPITSLETYLACHYLPNWYPLVAEFTPETKVFHVTGALAAELKALGWGKYFVKDYVKSLKTSVGSVVSKPEDIEHLLSDGEISRHN